MKAFIKNYRKSDGDPEWIEIDGVVKSEMLLHNNLIEIQTDTRRYITGPDNVIIIDFKVDTEQKKGNCNNCSKAKVCRYPKWGEKCPEDCSEWEEG